MNMGVVALPLAVVLAWSSSAGLGDESSQGGRTFETACSPLASPAALKQPSRWGGSHPCSEEQANPVTLVAPGVCATAMSGSAIEFEWSGPSDRPRNGWMLFIYKGVEVVDDFPFRVYEDVRDTRFTVSGGEALEPGEYVWYVVAYMGLGYQWSVDRRLTVVDSCPGDHNRDGTIDLMDLFAYHTVWSANVDKIVKPVASSGDSDFDGRVDLLDLVAFVADWSANLGMVCE
ncbi:MAG: hypothetical protein KF768_11660 [Phycisphaeraceae bacterium]|nr:hypothetical protein [Phycisphaeraceae bacterium]